jgi:hypothetical protein
MKIHNLEFKDYAAQKPVSISPSGEFISLSDIAEAPALSLGSTFQLDAGQRVQLTTERYTLEPDFRLGVIGVGLLTKDECLDHIQRETEFGREAVSAEMQYVNELLMALSGADSAAWPEMPESPFRPVPDWRRRKRCIYLKLTHRVLFCENTTDPVTTPFANYRIRRVHPVFRARGFNVLVNQGVDDVRANFVPRVKSPLTVYCSGIGHGNYGLYTGHGGNHILEVGHYDPVEVKGKAMHFLSCQTGRDLGPDTVAHGAKAYAGYRENFVLVWDDGTTPAVDEFELFARSDSVFDLKMALGATAKEAYKATVQAFDAAIAQVPGTVAATWLAWDRDNLVLHGEEAVKLQPYRAIRICYPIPRLEQEDALMEIGDLTEMPR